MKLLKKYKTILIVIVVVVVGGMAYNSYFGGEGGSILTSDLTSGSESAVSAADTDLLTLLLDIRSVKLDDSIFSEETFRSLEDFSQEIVPEPIGRENPFIPTDLSGEETE